MATCHPITVYPHAETAPEDRVPAPHDAPWFDTLGLLRDELGRLGAHDDYVTVEVDLSETQIRKDGWPRSGATPASPRVVVATPSRYGPLRFACDRYTDWRANVRAIAQGLAALRTLESSPITTMGEQYLGWAVLVGDPAPPGGSDFTDGFADPFEAARWMADRLDDVTADTLVDDPKARGRAYRTLARRLHPDTPTGDTDEFRRLDAARSRLDART